LNLDVIVPRTAGVERRHDGAKAERAVGSGDDMARYRKPMLSYSPSSFACQRSIAAPRSGRQLLVSTKPESSNRRPPAPGSRRSLRSGDLGLKNGPSVWRTVGSSPSRQEGVGASSCVRTASAQDNSHPAASMPVLSRNWRRVGFDSLVMSVAKLLIDRSQGGSSPDLTMLLPILRSD
jgi:hypothetical protein